MSDENAAINYEILLLRLENLNNQMSLLKAEISKDSVYLADNRNAIEEKVILYNYNMTLISKYRNKIDDASTSVDNFHLKVYQLYQTIYNNTQRGKPTIELVAEVWLLEKNINQIKEKINLYKDKITNAEIKKNEIDLTIEAFQKFKTEGFETTFQIDYLIDLENYLASLEVQPQPTQGKRVSNNVDDDEVNKRQKLIDLTDEDHGEVESHGIRSFTDAEIEGWLNQAALEDTKNASVTATNVTIPSFTQMYPPHLLFSQPTKEPPKRAEIQKRLEFLSYCKSLPDACALAHVVKGEKIKLKDEEYDLIAWTEKGHPKLDGEVLPFYLEKKDYVDPVTGMLLDKNRDPNVCNLGIEANSYRRYFVKPGLKGKQAIVEGTLEKMKQTKSNANRP